MISSKNDDRELILYRYSTSIYNIYSQSVHIHNYCVYIYMYYVYIYIIIHSNYVCAVYIHHMHTRCIH